MKMRNFLFVSTTALCLFAIGCGGAANTITTNTPANTTSANVAKKDEMVNAAPTLSPLFKAYCEAWAKKDEAGLRKVYSAETLKMFEEDMKAEKIKSLLKFLEDDAVSGNVCEVRNEEIQGDKAIAEIRTDTMPNGIKIEFVKENGEWKMTNKSPTVDGVKKSADTSITPTAPANSANKTVADPAAKKDK
jgi:hypothetical protein